MNQSLYLFPNSLNFFSFPLLFFNNSLFSDGGVFNENQRSLRSASRRSRHLNQVSFSSFFPFPGPLFLFRLLTPFFIKDYRWEEQAVPGFYLYFIISTQNFSLPCFTYFLFSYFFLFKEPPKKKPKVSIVLRCGTCAGELDSDYLCRTCPNGSFLYLSFFPPSSPYFLSSSCRTNPMSNLLQIFGTLQNTKQPPKWFSRMPLFCDIDFILLHLFLGVAQHGRLCKGVPAQGMALDLPPQTKAKQRFLYHLPFFFFFVI